MRTEDGYIINQCLNGNSSAFGFLVDKYKASVYAFAYSELRNFHDAEDVTQEVFIKAYQKLHTLRRWDNFLAWLYSITSNQCKMWIRSNSRRLDSDFIEDQETLKEPSSDQYNENPIIDTLKEALESLPDNYRQVLTLYYLGDMDSNEIARFLGTSPTAVRRSLTRARLKLREGVISMMSEIYEEKKLQARFTFRIVEAVKRININPVSLTKGLPWGLSTAIGLIAAIIGFNTNINFISQPELVTGALSQGESKVLDISEYPIDVMKVSNISVMSNGQMERSGLDSVLPNLQNALLMAPQAEGGTWTKKADMPTARTYLATSIVDGKIYAIGGMTMNQGLPMSTLEQYDPATDTWIKLANMPTARSGLSASAVNGKIYVIGGQTGEWNANLNSPSSIVEEYDIATDKWAKKADMPTARYKLTTCALNGKIYAIGGNESGRSSTTLEEYDPLLDKWTKKVNMSTERTYLSSCVANGKIYVIGGTNRNGLLSTVEEYDPILDKWTKKEDMPTARMALSSVAINDKIYAIGGSIYRAEWGWYQPIPTVEKYNIAMNKWSGEAGLQVARSHLCADLIDGKIYTIGGQDTNNRERSTVEEYDTNIVEKSINFKGKLPTTWGDVRTARGK